MTKCRSLPCPTVMADTYDDENHDRFPPLHGTSRLSRQHRSMRTQHALRSFPFQGRQDLRRKLGRERVFPRPPVQRSVATPAGDCRCSRPARRGRQHLADRSVVPFPQRLARQRRSRPSPACSCPARWRRTRSRHRATSLPSSRRLPLKHTASGQRAPDAGGAWPALRRAVSGREHGLLENVAVPEV